MKLVVTPRNVNGHEQRTSRRGTQWVKRGHAEQVAAAAGSPQKAALLAVGRDFCHGPEPVVEAWPNIAVQEYAFV